MQARSDREFGGAWGALTIIVVSHVLVYYLWISLQYYQGSFLHPTSIADFFPFWGRMWHHIVDGAALTLRGSLIYLTFLALQLLFAYVMPGITVKGLPVPTENNVQHSYLCNGIASWYVTLALAGSLHFSGVFRISTLADEMGPMITMAIIVATLLSVGAYIITCIRRQTTRASGNLFYDFFIGVVLNPRLGKVDLKFFAEIRIAWMLLFLMTLAAAAKQYETFGAVSWPMIFMIVAHGLYTNACMKGEECIPTTWDVFHEKWGWMLIFWNVVGVPFVYSFNSFFILKNGPFEHSTLYTIFLFVMLLGAYCVWDTSQSQKNRFRMQQRGTYVARKTFPQLPWHTLKNPRYLTTTKGSTLLTDGWWMYARKIHYTADVVMALTWALNCGFIGIMPYFYPAFFIAMIVHRAIRDEKRCAEKYGDDWEKYKSIVRYRFIPFVF